MKKNIGLLDQSDSVGQTPLIIAASLGHTNIVAYLILNKANVDLARRIEPAKTALQLAVENGYSPIIKILINAEAVITPQDAKSLLFKAATESEFELLTLLITKNPSLLNQTDEFGQSPLLLAVRYGSTSAAQSLVSGGHVAIVQYLIEKGAYINLAANGKTALHWASERNYPVVTNRLVEEGATDTPWGDGEYLVHKATRKGDLGLVKRLIEKNPDLLDQTDSFGQTALILAASLGDLDIVGFLVFKEADLMLAVIRPGHASHGKVALQLASENNHFELAMILIAAEKKKSLPMSIQPSSFFFDKTVRKNGTASELHILQPQKLALLSAILGNDLPTIKTLININPYLAFLPLNDAFGSRAIHIATEKGFKDIVRYLTTTYPELRNQRDGFGRTPLLLAVSLGHTSAYQSWVGEGHLGMINYLLEQGVDLNVATDRVGHVDHEKTALYWAYERRDEYDGILENMIRAGAVDTPRAGQYLVHTAAHDNHLGTIRLLLNQYPDLLDQTDHVGQTPLILAAQHGWDAGVWYLISKGANLKLIANNPAILSYPYTARDCANEKGFSKIAAMLRAAEEENQLTIDQKTSGLILEAREENEDSFKMK